MLVHYSIWDLRDNEWSRRARLNEAVKIKNKHLRRPQILTKIVFTYSFQIVQNGGIPKITFLDTPRNGGKYIGHASRLDHLSTAKVSPESVSQKHLSDFLFYQKLIFST